MPRAMLLVLAALALVFGSTGCVPATPSCAPDACATSTPPCDDCGETMEILHVVIDQGGKLPDPRVPVTIDDPEAMAELAAVLDAHDAMNEDLTTALGLCTDQTTTTLEYVNGRGDAYTVTYEPCGTPLGEALGPLVEGWLDELP